MNQLQLIHTYQPSRPSVPADPPFTAGQTTVRNTNLDRTGLVLEQRRDPCMPAEWWLRVQLDDGGTTSWWARICEVA